MSSQNCHSAAREMPPSRWLASECSVAVHNIKNSRVYLSFQLLHCICCMLNYFLAFFNILCNVGMLPVLLFVNNSSAFNYFNYFSGILIY